MDTPTIERRDRARRLAALAFELQQRLEAFPEHVDASWQSVLPLPTPEVLAQAGAARGRLGLTLFHRACGPLPPLSALDSQPGRLMLQAREPLLRSLCLLALLGRPGVLRCCVERSARHDMKTFLGKAFSVLQAQSAGATAVPGDVAAWQPLAWSWVGYAELLKAETWPHPSMRRLVRLALPADHDVAPPLIRVPTPDSSPVHRLDELARLQASVAAC